MPDIVGINNVTAAGSPLKIGGGQDISKDAFLQMLITQLKNQDPLQPMESQEFASQLAEFSSLESLNSIDSNVLESVTADYVLTQSINNTMATTLIGRNATMVGNQINLVGEDNIDLQYSLSGEAESAVINIRDEDGNVIRTIENHDPHLGNNSIEWDGKDNDGNSVDRDQTYTFTVEAENARGETVQNMTFTTGPISSVRYENGVAILVINGEEFSLEDVIEVGV